MAAMTSFTAGNGLASPHQSDDRRRCGQRHDHRRRRRRHLLGGDGNDYHRRTRQRIGASRRRRRHVLWNPGDGSDTVEGQAGVDTLLFNGANIAEKIDISANGGRLRFTRDVGNITMDLNDVERINFNALGGADNIVINDLSGTDVTEVNIDLRARPAVGDGAADQVIVERHERSAMWSMWRDRPVPSV